MSRIFETGATRDTDENKIDYDGFLSPEAIEAYGTYMMHHQKQADGTMRASDNWKKGIPLDAYMKSMWRHFFAVWKNYNNNELYQEDLCALFFNVQGMLHETIKKENENE